MNSKFFNISVQAIWYSQQNESNTCKQPEITNYPDWFTYKPPRYDVITICLFISVYLFIWMAIVCDEYCIPAIESICFRTLRLSYNVAGATFLAIATSAPEFFCSLFSNLLTDGQLGLGTIVGSSVFNSLAISAICAFKARSVCLDWWPMTRDLGWYFLAVGLLTFVLFDYKVVWYEALTMVLTFIINLTCLALDDRIQKLRNPNRQCPCICFRPPCEVIDLKFVNYDTTENTEENEDVENVFSFSKWPSSHIKKFWWILIYPIHCVLFITTPNIRRYFSHKWATFSLIISIAWIALLSFLISWMLTVIGFNLNVPESVMGIIFLAIGASIPEAITSYITTAKGYGSMAVCNAISSNSFDVLFGLGVPWLIKHLLHIKDIHKYVIELEVSNMVAPIFALFVSILFMYIVFMSARFRLCISIGIFFLLGYIGYVAMAVQFELTCPRTKPLCPIQYK